jgi:hypothetical protein
MDISDHTRRERRLLVLQTIQTLKEAFPLESHIEDANVLLRQAYIDTLSYWIGHGTPPAKDYVAEPLLEALRSLDALVIEEQGVSCYPFSARDTKIQVSYAGMSVHAICAFGALAIPALVQNEARISAVCAVCRGHIVCSVEANGSVDGGYSEGLRVIWTHEVAAGIGRPSVCEDIAFICANCMEPQEAISFTIPQAAAVGNNFFSFQRRLLVQQQS